jgi:CheY-like chemotaxis protein
MVEAAEQRRGVLIVEDEMLVASLIEDAILEMDLEALGPASTVAMALKMIEDTPPEGVLLDLNLAGAPAYPIADALAARGIPFAFVTGYGADGVRKDFADRPVLQKPFAIEQVQDVVRQMMAR